MTDLGDLIVPNAVFLRLAAPTKRQALQTLTEALAEAVKLDARVAFDGVLMRERLGGTGAGDGVAIPHARVAGLDRPVGAFARLDPPQDFDAMDGRPADLVFLLLAPEDRGADHLKALARVARFLRRAEVRDKIRSARTRDVLLALLAQSPPRNDAAA
jgi:PTS system nitrogen regulatory IIA component